MSKEIDPHFTVQIGGEQIDARRNNASLWTFLGRLATYNHILIDADPEDMEAQVYVIRAREKQFGKLMGTMLVCEYPCHLNLPELPDYVTNNIDAWDEPSPFKPPQQPEWYGKLGETPDE